MLTVEQLEDRLFLSHAPPLPATLRVSVKETNLEHFDTIEVRYEGPPQSDLRTLGLFFGPSAGSIRVDTDGPAFNVGAPCDTPPKTCGPVVLKDSGVGLAGISAVDGGDRITFRFTQFDSNDEFVVGLDLDRLKPFPQSVFSGSDLNGTWVRGIAAGPEALPTLFSATLRASGSATAESAETRTLARHRPLTIIAHGLQPRQVRQPWVSAMHDALLTQGFTEPDIIVFDWAKRSNVPSRGWVEAEGQRLSGLMLARMLQAPEEQFAFHFIGHSRGASVISEAVQRLLAWGTAIPSLGSRIMDIQMTFLDSHPARPTSPVSVARVWAGLEPVLATAQLAMSDPLAAVWKRVIFADAYIQRNTAEACGAPLNLLGRPIAATFEAQVTTVVAPDGTQRRLCHGDVPLWYVDTIRDPLAWKQGWYYSLGAPVFDLRPAPNRPGTPSVPVLDRSLFNGNFRFTSDGSVTAGLITAIPRFGPLLRDLGFVQPAPAGVVPAYTTSNVRFPTFLGVSLQRAQLLPDSVLRRDVVFAPPGATSMVFDIKQLNLPGTTVLAVKVRDLVTPGAPWVTVYARPLSAHTTGTTVRVPLTDALDLSRGAVFHLEVRLRGTGSTDLHIDNLRIE